MMRWAPLARGADVVMRAGYRFLQMADLFDMKDVAWFLSWVKCDESRVIMRSGIVRLNLVGNAIEGLGDTHKASRQSPLRPLIFFATTTARKIARAS
jgi:hypothetical protein